MADKPEFVDMISDATRQNRRRAMPDIIEPEVKETSRLAHRSARMEQWRTENADAVEAQALGVSSIGIR